MQFNSIRIFCYSSKQLHLPISRLRHDGEGVFWVLLELDIADVSGSIILTLPSGGGEITISVVFGVVEAIEQLLED